jgi:hypothetical protein
LQISPESIVLRLQEADSQAIALKVINDGNRNYFSTSSKTSSDLVNDLVLSGPEYPY